MNDGEHKKLNTCSLPRVYPQNMWLQLILFVVYHVGLAVCGKRATEEFRMPGVRAYTNDAYLCYAEPLPRETRYITAFEPVYDELVTHHMLLFGCQDVPTDSNVWDCGVEPDYQPVCAGNGKILFSWAMNAPGFKMPENTSLPVGGELYNYLVLQVHYKDADYFTSSPGKKDTSGWRLTVQTTPTQFLAGIYLFVMDGEIGPLGFTTLRGGCKYTGFAVLHPIAFRVHTHGHGTHVEAYVKNPTGRYLIGEMSPHKPQTFYPVQNVSLHIFPGDKMFAQCLMTNNEDRQIPVGDTRQDEMCNFYMMYSVDRKDAEQLLDENNQGCFSEDTLFKDFQSLGISNPSGNPVEEEYLPEE